VLKILDSGGLRNLSAVRGGNRNHFGDFPGKFQKCDEFSH